MRRRERLFALRVDPVRCDGFGHCHELAPELVDLDEWGYPVLERDPTPTSDRAALESAHYAVRGCPRQALRVERLNED